MDEYTEQTSAALRNLNADLLGMALQTENVSAHDFQAFCEGHGSLSKNYYMSTFIFIHGSFHLCFNMHMATWGDSAAPDSRLSASDVCVCTTPSLPQSLPY
jgi:hypothetical protein